MATRRILTVDEVCRSTAVEGGLLLKPGIVFRPGEKFGSGDKIVLERPDGSTLETTIRCLETPAVRPRRGKLCIVLEGISRVDVPLGTHVWSMGGNLPAAPPTCELPNRVRVRVDHPRAEGLAITLKFGMAAKNSFGYTLFLGPDGTAEVSGTELLEYFDSERDLAMMDFIEPRTGFTGRITAQVRTTDQLRGAIAAVKMFSPYTAYPKNYQQNLTAALARGEMLDDVKIQIEVT